MIRTLVKKLNSDHTVKEFNSKTNIIEKLNYYRKLSNNGIHKLSESEQLILRQDIFNFFNMTVGLLREVGAEDEPVLYRSTVNRKIPPNKNELLTEICNLTGPPRRTKVNFETLGRCSLGTTPVFYASNSFKASLLESKPDIGDLVTVSEWKIKPNVTLFGHLVFHPEYNSDSTLHRIYKDAIRQIPTEHSEIYDEVLKFLTEEYMKKVDDKHPINYLFSSIHSHNVHEARKANWETIKRDTVIYPSAKLLNAINYTILDHIVHEKLILGSIYVGIFNADSFLSPAENISINYPQDPFNTGKIKY